MYIIWRVYVQHCTVWDVPYFICTPTLKDDGFLNYSVGDSCTFLKESDKILTLQKKLLKVPTMNKPFRFNFSKNTDKNLRFQIPIIFGQGHKKWNVSIRTTLFNPLISIIRTMEHRSNKRSRDWQNVFAMTRFRYIKLLFHILGLQPRDKAAVLLVNAI